MNSKMNQDNKVRRVTFLKRLLAGGVALLAVGIPKIKAEETETVKMLTPDGKLVVVPKSKIKHSVGSPTASNTQVKNWMNNKTGKAI